MFYSIHESLTPCTLAEVKALPWDVPFVAVLFIVSYLVVGKAAKKDRYIVQY